MKTNSRLERAAAFALAAALAVVAWIVVAAVSPKGLRLPSLTIEVTLVLTVLVAALGLVSAVALRQTR